MMGDPHIGFIIAAYAVAVGDDRRDDRLGRPGLRRLNAQLDQATRALDSARGGAKGAARR